MHHNIKYMYYNGKNYTFLSSVHLQNGLFCRLVHLHCLFYLSSQFVCGTHYFLNYPSSAFPQQFNIMQPSPLPHNLLTTSRWLGPAQLAPSTLPMVWKYIRLTLIVFRLNSITPSLLPPSHHMYCPCFCCSCLPPTRTLIKRFRLSNPRVSFCPQFQCSILNRAITISNPSHAVIAVMPWTPRGCFTGSPSLATTLELFINTQYVINLSSAILIHLQISIFFCLTYWVGQHLFYFPLWPLAFSRVNLNVRIFLIFSLP